MQYCELSAVSDVACKKVTINGFNRWYIQVACRDFNFDPIGLPFDGASFCFHKIGLFRCELYNLRDLGYMVPDSVFDLIFKEMTSERTTCKLGA